MTDKLPPNLLALFAPRPPLRWVEAPDYAPEKRRTANIDGLAAFLPELKTYKENDASVPTESWLEARDRKKQEKKAAVDDLSVNVTKYYTPSDDPNIRGDAFKTLIVARLSYAATVQDLEHEFLRFGPIERIRIVDSHKFDTGNKKKKPHRGYAFIVFEREKDMRAALDACDGIRIKDRRIKVDVERGRTVKGWKPRRLGGGLGGRGYTKALPARPGGPGGFVGGGGFRGRGGFDGGRGRGGGFRGGFGGGRGGGGGFRGGDRDFGGPPRGDRGDRGDRNGFAPRDAPSGPGGFDRRNGDRGDRGGFDRGGGGGGRFDDRRGDRDRDHRDRDRDRGDRPPRDGPRDGGRFGDRDGGRRPGGTGGNNEPIGRRDGPRDGGRDGGRDSGREGGYRDRDRDFDRPRDDDSRKRGYEGSGHEDPRKLRRY